MGSLYRYVCDEEPLTFNRGIVRMETGIRQVDRWKHS